MTAINPAVALHTHTHTQAQFTALTPAQAHILVHQRCHFDRRAPTSALLNGITSLILHKHNHRNPNHISNPVCFILRSPEITRQQPTHGSCWSAKLGSPDTLRSSPPLPFNTLADCFPPCRRWRWRKMSTG